MTYTTEMEKQKLNQILDFSAREVSYGTDVSEIRVGEQCSVSVSIGEQCSVAVGAGEQCSVLGSAYMVCFKLDGEYDIYSL